MCPHRSPTMAYLRVFPSTLVPRSYDLQTARQSCSLTMWTTSAPEVRGRWLSSPFGTISGNAHHSNARDEPLPEAAAHARGNQLHTLVQRGMLAQRLAVS